MVLAKWTFLARFFKRFDNNRLITCVSLQTKVVSKGAFLWENLRLIPKRILRFFTKQINSRSLDTWCIKGTEESSPRVDYSVPLMHHDLNDLGIIYLVKKCKIDFGCKNPIVDFPKKRTLKLWSQSTAQMQCRLKKILETCVL